jgi:hypothetical protein
LPTSENDAIDLSRIIDRPLIPNMVDEIMKALGQSEEAAYRVWLLLGNKFGAGQRLC